MEALTGRVAVVAGGAGAIGRAIGAGLLAAGARVVLADRSREVGKVAAELAARHGRSALGLQANLADADEVASVFEETLSVHGGLYTLVHAAGIYPRVGVLDLSPAVWDETQGANMRSFFLCTQAALRTMLPQGSGRIIGLGSGVGVAARPRSSAYAASKAALMAFTRAVAAELGDCGVTINCISPGITESPMMRGANSDDEVRASIARTGRPVTEPSELVEPVMFLLSQASAAISGTTLWLRPPG
jgi:NAD(P)-dependent dehydrogenase (short-subunit alcohol dehydrogenase family)